MRRRAVLLLLLVGVGACGSPKTPASARESSLAEQARDRGDHAAAARHYERAASASRKPREAEEARYRAADSFARAGDAPRAEAIYRRLAQGATGERAARADFELAELMAKAGREDEAQAQRLAAVRRHPNSGLAARALLAYLDVLREQGAERVLSLLSELDATLGTTELAETIAYRRARELDTLQRSAEARDAYLRCAERFPYPSGAYWDDALYRAAEAELALGSPERAIAHLSRMLAEQEHASISGSYQRGRYAEAQLKIALIYRDVLRDHARARSELRKLWQRHPTSRLVDDALFQEALLARQDGDRQGACAALDILLRELPSSRYAPCAHLLCDRLAPAAGRGCHDYIKRDAGLTSAADDHSE